MALLVTVAELEQYMHLSGVSNTEQEAAHTAALLWAQAALWSYTDYCEQATVVGEAQDSSPILLPGKLPIITVTAVYYDDVEYDDDDYYVYETYIRVPSISTIGTPQIVTIDYKGGISRDDVEPDGLGVVDTGTVGYKYTIQAQMAIKQLAEWALQKNRGHLPNSEESMRVRDMIYTYLPKVIRI